MKIFSAIAHFFKRSGANITSASYERKNPTVFHWKLLLLLFVALLLCVGILGVFLYEYFVVGQSAVEGEGTGAAGLFDEKKLDAVVERLQKKDATQTKMGTSSVLFIDPSVPF